MWREGVFATIRLTIFCFCVQDVSGVGLDEESVSVMEGDSFTLNTDVETNQQESTMWYFKEDRVARISPDKTIICTDDQCKEIFEGRVKLDNQTGSLTITNAKTTDSGEYKLVTKLDRTIMYKKSFNVTVYGVSAAGRVEVKSLSVKEGESVTLESAGIKSTKDSLKWNFEKTLIAELTGDQIQICTDDQCKERFRDRLKVDRHTGSLIITDTRTTDSGEYKLKIFSISSSRVRNFSVDVTAPGSSSAAVKRACVYSGFFLLGLALGVICFCKQQPKKKEADPEIDLSESPTQTNGHPETNSSVDS